MDMNEATNKRYLDKLARILDEPDRPSWWTANDFEDLLKRRNAGPRLPKHDQKELLNHLKESMVRWMLRTMMTGDMNDVRHMARTLRSYGIAWPELITIEHSLNAADKSRPKLDEDGDEGLYGQEWRDKLEFNEHLANLLDAIKGNRSFDMVFSLKEMGYLEFETVLSERSMSTIRAGKDKVIRSMLECMKSGDISRIGMTKAVQALNNIGINWPELDVIWKSLQAELSRKPINEDDRYQRQMMWDSDWLLSQNVPNGNYWAVSTAISDMRHAKVDAAGINSVLSKHRESITLMQENMLKSDSGAVHAALSNIRMMAKNGIEWPELREMIEQQKQNVMYWVLHEIAHETNTNDMPILYSDLTDMGVRWPEFNIIERSLKSQAKGR